MKCVITNNDTKNLTKNIPLSLEGRKLLPEVIEAYNKKLGDEYIEKALGRAAELGTEIEDEDRLRESFRKLAPKIKKNKMLQLLGMKAPEALDALNKVLG